MWLTDLTTAFKTPKYEIVLKLSAFPPREAMELQANLFDNSSRTQRKERISGQTGGFCCQIVAKSSTPKYLNSEDNFAS